MTGCSQTISCHPSWLQFWHLCQSCSSHQSTLDPMAANAQKTLYHGHHHCHQYHPAGAKAHPQPFILSLQNYRDFLHCRIVSWPLGHDQKTSRDRARLLGQMRADVGINLIGHVYHLSPLNYVLGCYLAAHDTVLRL